MKYRIWSKLSNCYTHEPEYPGSSLHCTSNYYLDTDGNIVDFITTLGSNQDDATKDIVNQEDYKIELCTNFKTTNGEYLFEGDIVEFKLGLKMVKGTIVFNCFRFWIYEVRGGCMGFNQHEYKVIGNCNKNINDI